MNDNYIWKEDYFPVKIQYQDTEEFRICKINTDIESERTFIVIQLSVGENRND
jgi:hypothetical protein